MGLRGPQVKESVFKQKETPKSNRPTKYRKRVKKIKATDCAPTNLLNPVSEMKEDTLMDDLIWVYQQLGGRQQLLSLLQTDPKAKKDFLKTLLAHETKKLEKAGTNGGGGKGKLLILKGLYEDKPGEKADDKTKYANILDPNSQRKEAFIETEDYVFETEEPEEVVIQQEIIV